MFGWEFPPQNSGGLGTACLGLTKALSEKDVSVTFILPQKLSIPQGKNFKVKFAQDSHSVITIAVDSIIQPYLSNLQYFQLKKGQSDYGEDLFSEIKRYTSSVQSLIQQEDFDLIHAHDWMSFPAGILAKHLTGKPLIVHVHSTEIDRTGGNSPNQQILQIEKEGMDKADLIIAVSEYEKNIIEQFYHIPPSKIKVVHNGINILDYQLGQPTAVNKMKQSGYKIILFVGRITLQKGVEYFLLSARKVLNYYPKVLFVITGSGDMERQMITLAAQLQISDKVFFTGFLRGSQLQQIYKMADLFVMPSVSEPFGITALEAVANNAPVLLSKQSGVREVLTHVLTANFWDTDELANKMLAVLNYDTLKLTLQKNSLNQLSSINWNQAASKCISIYKQVLDSYFQRSS